jgi:hypothetical protein
VTQYPVTVIERQHHRLVRQQPHEVGEAGPSDDGAVLGSPDTDARSDTSMSVMPRRSFPSLGWMRMPSAPAPLRVDRPRNDGERVQLVREQVA